MKNFQKIGVLLAVLSVGVAFGGYVFYRQAYKKPRAALMEQRVQLENQIKGGKKQIEQMKQGAAFLSPMYARSFPLNAANSRLEYQIWLTQMLEFCNIQDATVQPGQYLAPRNSRLATQTFAVRAKCSLVDLTQFLYEFYWSPLLQRITVLDVQPQEGSDLLNVSLTIEGLTILYRSPDNPNSRYPSVNKLPLETSPIQQLASGPFATYQESLENVDLFRAIKTGVDAANFTTLTGLPTITDENGKTVKFTRWRDETQGTTLNCKVGDRLKIGSFDAIIAEVSDDMVILRQGSENSVRTWTLPLGYKLNEAVAVPSNLF